MREKREFDELTFFADVKKSPAIYFGSPSLLSLRDQLLGMEYAFSFCKDETPLRYFRAFISWYHSELLDDQNGYACWWNHLLYTCGNDDRYAFEWFFVLFERYLHDVHQINLPTVEA